MTEPTDAEILALLAEKKPTPSLVFLAKDDAKLADLQAAAVAIARAVLAKWRAPPAVAGEPVACGNCGGTGWMVRDPDIGTDQECFVCGGSGGYSESATPQPTQAQAGAVPLTDEQLEKLRIGQEYWQWGLSANVFRHVGRSIEAAHGIGIKGGQHGL